MSARRPWAYPLVPPYAAALAAKDALRRLGILRARKLTWPVVSVGSLSAGGAGKTPVVIALADLLKQRGWSIDILSRGYRREGRIVDRVDPIADNAASLFGDEPVLIARTSGVPVWLGAERFAAGTLAEESAASQHPVDSSAALQSDKPGRAHLLDDGFQHRQLARTIDIVLLTAEDLRDVLLPAGNLRESLSALRRADAVVLREEEHAQMEPQLLHRIRKRTLVWKVRRELRFPAPLGVLSAGSRPLAFCGIARPENFSAMLAKAGCKLADTVAFADHRNYKMPDMDRLLEVARKSGATGFMTTEKDWVKLAGPMADRLRELGPVCVVGLETRFVEEAEVVRELEARLL